MRWQGEEESEEPTGNPQKQVQEVPESNWHLVASLSENPQEARELVSTLENP